MKTRTSVSEFARLLYDADGAVDLYKLHTDYKIGPAEILYNVRLFTRLRMIREEADGRISVIQDAKERLWVLRRRLALNEGRPWAEVNLERMPPNTPYMPRLSKVDREFFYAKVDMAGKAS